MSRYHRKCPPTRNRRGSATGGTREASGCAHPFVQIGKRFDSVDFPKVGTPPGVPSRRETRTSLRTCVCTARVERLERRYRVENRVRNATRRVRLWSSPPMSLGKVPRMATNCRTSPQPASCRNRVSWFRHRSTDRLAIEAVTALVHRTAARWVRARARIAAAAAAAAAAGTRVGRPTWVLARRSPRKQRRSGIKSAVAEEAAGAEGTEEGAAVEEDAAAVVVVLVTSLSPYP